MKKDTHKTNVVFRKWNNGDILALFPDIPERAHGVDCLSYMHTGQHGGASYAHCVNITKPAKEAEYKPLFNELESIGYNLRVMKRRVY